MLAQFYIQSEKKNPKKGEKGCTKKGGEKETN